ncbi:MAG: NAD(P)H-dependent glycerol-3-phosphate dehydrogenase [Deltaproteobacteria bacterium]|nr:NAD(P)H-dependent glycerol-3-phosphate dehydrogenase [Deltaproteobacteria bacterium]
MRIGVVGGGSWGTTLANLLSNKGYDVTFWVYEEDLCRTINESHENTLYLKDITLSNELRASNSISQVIEEKDLLLFVTPSHVARAILTEASDHINEDQILVSATKGIEESTLKTNSQVIEEILSPSISKNTVYLSGPSFAREVAIRQPTAVTVASQNEKRAQSVQEIFSTDYFRVYRSSDIIGLEVGGSIKNVIALGAGISDGLGFGSNARAALITRGLAEMLRLGVKMGANAMTFSGLSGLGDLVLTCTGDLSRNRNVGLRLGKGEKIGDILSDMKMVAEGVKTAKAAYDLSRKISVEMPITECIYNIIYNDMNAREAVSTLMTRELKEELTK